MIRKSAVLYILICVFILLFAAACGTESKDPIISESTNMGEVTTSPADGAYEPSSEESVSSDEGSSASGLADELLNLEAEDGWYWQWIQAETMELKSRAVMCKVMIPDSWTVNPKRPRNLIFGGTASISLEIVDESSASYMRYKERIAPLEQIDTGNRILYFENLGAGTPGRYENDSLSPYYYNYYFEESGYLFICNFLWRGKGDTQQMEIFEKVVSSITINE